ncbi:helix-turn-helix domain-containing protein [Eubacterium sp.]
MNLNNQYITIGRRIQSRRKELRIKQSELAEKLDISSNHISSIENGREKPSLDTLLKICEELKATPDYFLLGNVHANNIPANITEGLLLCSKEDIELARNFIELLINRNKDIWNKDNFI